MPANQVTVAARASTCAYSIIASKFVTNYRVDKIKGGSPRSCSIVAAILEPTNSHEKCNKKGKVNGFEVSNALDMLGTITLNVVHLVHG